ncbi:Hsp33 family molecular chaperone HslO [Haloferula sp.]|uniref:Hsp33 family molecular chaperone HslO n=1 Tax=Haloferula sp. TaxID=2497595 RepID=UPI00329AA122
MSAEQVPAEEFTKIESIFVRHRNVLLVRGHFPGIYTDYYLHLMEEKIRHKEDLDQMLKDTLSMLVLHAVSRPWAETIAWTINLRAPRVNIFATASSIEESIVGRLFTEGVREPDRNFFFSQTVTKDLPEPRQSTLEVDDRDPLHWVEQYYTQSEQRPARSFRLDDEHFALVVAQPDFDEEWFSSLDEASVTRIQEDEETKTLETRKFRFQCGCDINKILPALGGWKDKPDELFEGADQINVQCPRCAASYLVTRDML